MAQAITSFIIFVIVAGGVIITLNRRTRNKARESSLEPMEPAKARPLSKRQQRIVATLEPTAELPSIEDLVAAEARDTGVNDIPGGAGLDVSLKLRVYWRDEIVRQGCTDGALEFRIEDGVDPATAETEDVRLVCVRGGVATPAPEPTDEREAGPKPDSQQADAGSAGGGEADPAGS